MKNHGIYIIAFLLFAGCHKDETPGPVPVVFSTHISFDKNPAGYWQVGYADTLGSAFMLSTSVDTANAIAMWHAAAGSAGYYPYLGQNRDSVTHTDPSNSWAARPAEIVMEASNSGQYSLLRFVAPAAGRYKIKAQFAGVHFRLSSTDVHVLLNGQSLFSDVVEGYGGDSLFHAITGTHPIASFEETVTLQANDVVTFAVGYGPNKNHANDTTGLLVEVSRE
jgi:hypothetical protein